MLGYDRVLAGEQNVFLQHVYNVRSDGPLGRVVVFNPLHEAEDDVVVTFLSFRLLLLVLDLADIPLVLVDSNNKGLDWVLHCSQQLATLGLAGSSSSSSILSTMSATVRQVSSSPSSSDSLLLLLLMLSLSLLLSLSPLGLTLLTSFSGPQV